MSKDVDIVQLRNEDGDYVYVKAHLDGIDGMEEYTESLTSSIQFMGDYIFDTGWKAYDYNAGNGIKIDTNYKTDGFKCGIREIVLNPSEFGNGNQTRMKMIRINVKNFSSGMQLFQLPKGFVQYAVRFQMSGNGHRLPYTLEILPDGKVVVFVHPLEQKNSSVSNWVYGQFTWIE